MNDSPVDQGDGCAGFERELIGAEPPWRAFTVVRDGDVYGHTVNLASRIAGHAPAGELLMSSETADLLSGIGVECEDASQVELKGIPEPVGLVRIRPAKTSDRS